MPSFNKLRVSNLKLTKSEISPVDKIIGSRTLSKHESGRTFRVENPAFACTVLLPSAEKGRSVSFIVTQKLTSVVTIQIKRTGDVINGELLVLDGHYTFLKNNPTASAVIGYVPASNTTVTASFGYLLTNTTSQSVPNVYNVNAQSATYVDLGISCSIGTKIDFVCLQDGIWTATGTGFGADITEAVDSTLTTHIFNVTYATLG